jgi:hypothetical protein
VRRHNIPIGPLRALLTAFRFPFRVDPVIKQDPAKQAQTQPAQVPPAGPQTHR